MNRIMAGAAATAVLLSLAAASRAVSAAEPPAPMVSPHRNELGFFDIHVCNWSDRPLFYMALFSTTRFDEIASIEILDADHRALGTLDLGQYRLERVPGKPEKRVYMRQIPIPAGARDGWFSAKIKPRRGAEVLARDYVVITRLGRVDRATPAPEAEDIPLPRELSWSAIPGAKHYQVYIHDLWEDQKLIFTSPLLAEPRLPLPAGLLKAGGYYAWRVHARDVNEHELLGDFNHGSLGPLMRFSVAQ